MARRSVDRRYGTFLRTRNSKKVQKFNTRQAYECLKMSIDNRSYEAAAAVLRKFHADASTSLLTNNPAKVDGLRKHGVNAVGNQFLICGWDQPAVR